MPKSPEIEHLQRAVDAVKQHLVPEKKTEPEPEPETETEREPLEHIPPYLQ